MTSDSHAVFDLPAAPPRANGELVFEEPWESRAFGIAVALHDAGAVDFEDFRTRLIEEIAAWESREGAGDGAYRYYERWLRALETTLLAGGVVEEAELAVERGRRGHAWAHDHA